MILKYQSIMANRKPWIFLWLMVPKMKITTAHSNKRSMTPPIKLLTPQEWEAHAQMMPLTLLTAQHTKLARGTPMTIFTIHKVTRVKICLVVNSHWLIWISREVKTSPRWRKFHTFRPATIITCCSNLALPRITWIKQRIWLVTRSKEMRELQKSWEN